MRLLTITHFLSQKSMTVIDFLSQLNKPEHENETKKRFRFSLTGKVALILSLYRDIQTSLALGIFPYDVF